MRVKLTCGRVGIGFDQSPGDVIELPDAEARRMIEAGSAEPAARHEESRARESAMAGPRENAARPAVAARR